MVAVRIADKGTCIKMTPDDIRIFDGLGENLDGNYCEIYHFGIEFCENGERAAGLNPDEMYVAGDATVGGDLNVTGKKHRIVQTPNYGKLCLSAYETASPMFGDVGSGQIGEDGQSYVWLDPMLTQVISGEYQVFLQGYCGCAVLCL